MKLSERIKCLREEGEGAWRGRVKKDDAATEIRQSLAKSENYTKRGDKSETKEEDEDEVMVVGSVLGRLSLLEESQEGWRRRVGRKDDGVLKQQKVDSDAVSVGVVVSKLGSENEKKKEEEEVDCSFEEYVSGLGDVVVLLGGGVAGGRPRRKKTRKPNNNKKRRNRVNMDDDVLDEGVKFGLESVEDYGGVELRGRGGEEVEWPERVVFEVVEVNNGRFAQVREIQKRQRRGRSSCHVVVLPREGVVCKVRGGGSLRCRTRMDEFAGELVGAGEFGLRRATSRVVQDDQSRRGEEELLKLEECDEASGGGSSSVVGSDRVYVWGGGVHGGGGGGGWSLEEEGVLWDAEVVRSAWEKKRVLLFWFGVEVFLVGGSLREVDVSEFDFKGSRGGGVVVVKRGVDPPPQFKFKFVNWGGVVRRTGGVVIIKSKQHGANTKWGKEDEDHGRKFFSLVAVDDDVEEEEEFVYEGVVVGERPDILQREKDCLRGYRVRLDGQPRRWKLVGEKFVEDKTSDNLLMSVFSSGGCYVVRVGWMVVGVVRKLVTKEETEVVQGRRGRGMWFLVYGADAKGIDKGRVAGAFANSSGSGGGDGGDDVVGVYRSEDDSPGLVVVDEGGGGGGGGGLGAVPWFVGVWRDKMVIVEDEETKQTDGRGRVFYLVGVGRRGVVSWYLREVKRECCSLEGEWVWRKRGEYSYVVVSPSGGEFAVFPRSQAEREVLLGVVGSVGGVVERSQVLEDVLEGRSRFPLAWRFGVVQGLVIERVGMPLTGRKLREILLATEYPGAVFIRGCAGAGGSGHLVMRLWGGVQYNELRRAVFESVSRSCEGEFTVSFYRGCDSNRGGFYTGVTRVFPYDEEGDRQCDDGGRVMVFGGEEVRSVLREVEESCTDVGGGGGGGRRSLVGRCLEIVKVRQQQQQQRDETVVKEDESEEEETSGSVDEVSSEDATSRPQQSESGDAGDVDVAVAVSESEGALLDDAVAVAAGEPAAAESESESVEQLLRKARLVSLFVSLSDLPSLLTASELELLVGVSSGGRSVHAGWSRVSLISRPLSRLLFELFVFLFEI